MGALPGSWRGKLPANHYQYPKPSLRRARRHGILYQMDVSDYMDWYIYFDLRNRSKEVLFSMVHEGDLLVDVGTNIGESVLNFARSAGPTGQVFGFEPDPANRDRCLRNLALNPGLRIEISSLALAAETREFTLYRVDPLNSGANRILSGDSSAEGVRVRSTSLDVFVETQVLSRLDLLKIDVEGFEMNVLRGGIGAIEHFRPKMFIEVDDNNLRAQGDSAAELVHFLEERGYDIHRAKDGAAIGSGFDFAGCHFDIVCLPERIS